MIRDLVKSDDSILETLDKLKVYDDPSLQEEFVFEEGQDKQIQLTLEGITCAACGWLIEKQLSKVEGIRSFRFFSIAYRLLGEDVIIVN